jgi:hypothetical protein
LESAAEAMRGVSQMRDCLHVGIPPVWETDADGSQQDVDDAPRSH